MGMVDTVQNEESSPYHPGAGVGLGRAPRRNPWRDRTGRVQAHSGSLVAESSRRGPKRHVIRDDHAFLHGFATPVPGSWNGQRLECRQATCEKLLQEKAALETILRAECDVCKDERLSKARVADGGGEASAEFSGAKAIFATNAVKYHVNKLRAKAWAAKTGQVLHYAIAKDRISSMALRESQIWAKKN